MNHYLKEINQIKCDENYLILDLKLEVFSEEAYIDILYEIDEEIEIDLDDINFNNYISNKLNRMTGSELYEVISKLDRNQIEILKTVLSK